MNGCYSLKHGDWFKMKRSTVLCMMTICSAWKKYECVQCVVAK